MKKIVGKIISLFNRIMNPHRYSSDAFVRYLRSNGVKIGENTFFFAPKSIDIDSRRFEYVEIGSSCCITAGVQILCHDYSWSMLRKSHNVILPDPGSKVIIGDNVFLGWNVIVMPGVTIGSNVIVGAHSVVSKNIPDNTVCAGNPAKVICSLDEFYEKKKHMLVKNAFLRARFIYESKKRLPTKMEMGWFCVLFLERNEGSETFLRRMPFRGDSMDQVIGTFYSSQPLFGCFEDFLAAAIPEKNLSDGVDLCHVI